jgi:hypothetical protein
MTFRPALLGVAPLLPKAYFGALRLNCACGLRTPQFSVRWFLFFSNCAAQEGSYNFNCSAFYGGILDHGAENN